MRVSLAEVREVFDRLLTGESRKVASAWALERMQAADAGAIIYEPQDAESRIWVAITFLGGVDLITDMAGNYLYGPLDFADNRP